MTCTQGAANPHQSILSPLSGWHLSCDLPYSGVADGIWPIDREDSQDSAQYNVCRYKSIYSYKITVSFIV